MTDISSLQATLDELVAERAIGQLLARYAHTVDYGTETDYPLLFTDDGAFELQSGARNRFAPEEPFPYGDDHFVSRGGVRTEKGFRFAGKDALLRFISGVNGNRLRLHAVLQPQIRLGNGEAWVQSQMIAVGKELGEPHKLLVFGRYFDHVVRGADGSWLFRERICEV